MQAEEVLPAPSFEDYLEADTDAAEHSRQYVAAVVLVASVLLGLIGNMLFYFRQLGINVFIYTGIVLLLTFWLMIMLRRPMFAKNAIFAAPAAGFALLLAVRHCPQLLMFNLLALAGSLLVVFRFSSAARFLGGHWLVPAFTFVNTLLLDWIESPVAVLGNSQRWFGRLDLGTSRQKDLLRSVLRGALITLPVITIFGLLLSSADAVFGDLLADGLGMFIPGSIGSIIGQVFVIAAFSWLSMVALQPLLMDAPPNASPEAAAAAKPGFRLNMIEATMVLGSVNLLFLVFVIIQARYLFGGEANINLEGYTYADYARRGFYELLAVSIMTAGLLVSLDKFTYRKREEIRLFYLLAVGMVGLTLVILVAAFRRLDLYENAYGFTQIRVMSGVFMIWLAALILLLGIAIVKQRQAWFWTGCIVIGLGFILTLNVMNMDGFIARRNIERYKDTGKLDVPYLLTLSDDAIPTIAPLIDISGELGIYDQEQLLRGLGIRLFYLDQDHAERGPLEFHVAKTRAWIALDDYRTELGPYIRPDYRKYP